MSESERPMLHPAVVALAQDFERRDAEWRVPVDKLYAHQRTLQGLGPEPRPKLVTDLVVLAARFEREDRAAARGAVAQLLALAILLLGGAQAAQEAFEAGGVQGADARRLIGGSQLAFDDAAPAAPGQAAASLLGVLKKNR